MFRYIKPEVAGGFGEEVKLDVTARPLKVYELHYEFKEWACNDILTTFPCFIVTERLKEAILKADGTGVVFDYGKINTSYEFRQLFPKFVLPPFHRMKILGKAGEDDLESRRIRIGNFGKSV
ncbi:MAG: hypothetical protein P4L35_17755 [Ignavibacteriaceae bacterium]|nr:hypothetical protein [Ignavibacteriaceae bacterium]